MAVTGHLVTGGTSVPVTTITCHPVTAVTDSGALVRETSPRTKKESPSGRRTTREVEQMADKEISPREPSKAKDEKSEDKAATRVSRIRRVRRVKRMKK